MTRARILLGGLCAAALSTSLAAAQPLAVVNAEIFDATGAAPYRGTLVVDGGRILAVGPKVKAPRGATVIDAKGEALIPGLFDVHTHWTPNGVPDVTPRIADAYVAAGVTSVNDFHQQPESFAPRRAWLGTLTAPHVNFVARISTPGGHGADWADQATTRWVDTPEGARAAVEAIAAYKPDAIKAFTDGWRYGSAPDNTTMDAWTLKALTETAHKYGLKVLTHTVTVEQGKVAAISGVDVIAHSLQDAPLDADTIASIKASGLFYAPTLAVYEPVKPGAKPPADPDSPRARQSRLKFGYALSNAKALFEAGVPLALGTDAGMTGTPHGASTLRELELLVQAGLTPSQALTIGTAGSARAMNQLADRGTLEAGKRADFVMVAGKPWETISDARKVERVFIDGKLSYGPGAKRSAANDRIAPPAVKAQALIDDFERADGRTSLDTLRLDDFDGGRDRSLEVSQIIDREGGGKVLFVGARMAAKDDASAGVLLPLTRGSVVPTDATAFKGLKFAVRGDGGAYVVSLVGAAGRWTTKVEAGPGWKTVELPFSAFKPAGREKAAFTGTDLLQVGVAGERPAGAKLWFELDDVTFY
ncbi:amidohydrolase family protein [Caulobacter endophyticus]|uniref:amidohydrolase family protein n=1 Tax=Caulobacter endophyticus TaxID=2172652 RepID=UPI0024104D4B|nr:amidohydrolase family protein [Caulobacter endophyticus]MDG2528001.1 CIA30 family protein [Caulobacter endophyticus]